MRSFLQRFKKIVALALCFSLIAELIPAFEKKAAAAIILSADKDGNITWESEPTMATSGIRWETAGYLIYTAKTPDGNPKSSGLPFARIETGSDQVKTTTEYDPARGKYITKNIISADYIKKAITGNKELYAAFMKNVAAGNNTIYLNSFFRVYRLDNGKKTTLKDNIYSRDEIKKAQSWRDPSEWDTGKGYFNVKVEYKVTSNVYVKIADAYGNYLKDPYLAFDSKKEGYVGDTVKVNLPSEVVAGGKVYTLYRSYYYENTDSTEKKDDTRLTSDKENTLTKTIKLGLRYSMVVGRYKEKNTSGESEDSVEGEMAEPQVSVRLQSDIYDVTRGIPGHEGVYLRASADRYIYGYRLDNKTGSKSYTTYGKITWNLTYTTGEGEEEETHNDTVVMTYPVNITRDYSYWEIGNLEVYAPKTVTAINGAVAGENLTAGFSSADYPSVNYKHSSALSDHVKKPDKAETVIDLGVRSHEGEAPPPVSVFEEVNAAVGECKVSNDSLVIDGVTVLSDATGNGKGAAPNAGPAAPGKSETVSSVYIINPAKANDIYTSSASLTYAKIADIAGKGPQEINIAADDVNPVIIHTPVFVKGSIKDAIRYCELTAPDNSRFQLVLDRYFSVNLTNTGPHRALPGYGTRDYREYAAANEVSFPFDVYEGNRKISAETWLSLNSERTFYIPQTVGEGDYTIKFRSIAENAYANSAEGREELYANLDMSDYTAIDLIDVHVSGRIYDLNLTGVNGSLLDIPIGNNDKNGSPVRAGAVAPLLYGDRELAYSSGVFKKGYYFDYSITTMGDYGTERDGIVIEPSYYVLSRDGNSKVPVDVYRSDINSSAPAFLSVEKSKASEDGRIVTWSGTFTLPQDFYVLPKGFDINGLFAEKGMLTGYEPMFIRRGYLLICFDVYALKEGKKRLTLSAGNCKMWELQGGIKTKTDVYGNSFEFTSGDFVLYDLQKSLNEDVKVVVIY